MAIARYAVRRVLLGLVTLFVVSVLVFLLTQLLGDPARAILGRDANVPATLAAKRAELGLNRPAINQYFGWLWGIVRGDPGNSFTNGLPVVDFMGEHVRNSLFLIACAGFVGIPLSVLIGAYSALRRDRAFDTGTTYASLVVAAIPEFVIGTMLVVLLATNMWNIFPAVSEVRGDTMPWDDLPGMVLPTIALALIVFPYVARATRASMVEVLESDYVEMARLKGLSSRTVLWRHAFPNALGPTLQVIALSLAYLAGGIVVIERVFNYPGVGAALVDAVSPHNVPVVQFVAMFIAAFYITCNILADIGTILVTPRLRTRLR